jgi:hypothetical protein
MGLHRVGFDVTGIDINDQPEYPFAFQQGDALEQDLSLYDFVWASPPCQLYSGLIPAYQRELHGHKWNHQNLIPPVRDLLVASGKPYIIENVAGAKSELRDPIQVCGTFFPELRVFRHPLFETNVPITVDLKCNHKNKSLGTKSAKSRGRSAPAVVHWRRVVTLQRSRDGLRDVRYVKYISPEGLRFRSVKEIGRALGYDVGVCALPEKARPNTEAVQFYACYGQTGARGSMEEWQKALGVDWITDSRKLAQVVPPDYAEWLGRLVIKSLGFTIDYDPIGY